MEKITLWILCMAAITFAIRYSFFAHSLPIKLNRHAKQILIFTGPCILTAMWAPLVFDPAIINRDVLDPYLLAGLFTVAASFFIRQTLVVILLSMSVFYLLRWLL